MLHLRYLTEFWLRYVLNVWDLSKMNTLWGRIKSITEWINNLLYGRAFKGILPFFWWINARGAFTSLTKIYYGAFFAKTLHYRDNSCTVDDVELRNIQTICFCTFHSFITNLSFSGYDFTTILWNNHCTKNEVSIKDFFSKCDQIRSFLPIWSNLL